MPPGECLLALPSPRAEEAEDPLINDKPANIVDTCRAYSYTEACRSVEIFSADKWEDGTLYKFFLCNRSF